MLEALKAKRRSKQNPTFQVKERFDLKRKKLGIPADPSADLVEHRRKEQAAAEQAKAKREPRIVQRAKKQAAKEKLGKVIAERRKAIEKQLGPPVIPLAAFSDTENPSPQSRASGDGSPPERAAPVDCTT